MAMDLEMTVTIPVEDKRSFLIPFGIIKAVLKSRSKEFSIDIKGEKIRLSYDDKAVIFPIQDVADFPNSPLGELKEVGT